MSLSLLLANATLMLLETNTQLLSNLEQQLPEIDYKRACTSNRNFGSNDYTLVNDSSFGGNAINRNITIFKQTPLPLEMPPSTTIREQINSINHLTDLWRSNLEHFEENEGFGLWQYAGNSEVFGIYPAFDLGCPSYFPPGRPWWTSSTIGKGNYLFLLDTSAVSGIANGGSDRDVGEQHFNHLRNLTKEFVNSLSFYDYFVVIGYDVIGLRNNQNLVQATAANKASAISWIDSLIYGAVDSSNIGQILDESLDLLSESTENSNCHSYMIIITHGETEINSPSAYDILSEKGENITIASYYTSNTTISPIFEGMSCRTDGFVSNFSMNRTVEDALYEFNRYYSSKIRMNASWPRYSQVYEDAFGLGQMTTAGLSIYDDDGNVILVNAIDVPVSSTNRSSESINRQLLEVQSCEARNLNRSYTDHCHMQSGVSREDEPGMVKNKDTFFALTILASLFFVFFCMFWSSSPYVEKMGSMEPSNPLLLAAWSIGVLALIWFWVTYGLYIYPDQMEVEYWKSTNEYTVAKYNTSYPCTRTVDCGCSEFGGISCGTAANQLLTNGSLDWSLTCQTGYHCCRTRTYCGGYSTRCSSCGKSCRTCSTYCSNWITECIQSVGRRRCRQVRGYCYNSYVSVQYTIGKDQVINAIRSKGCGLNRTDCVSNHHGSFPEIGSSRKVYYKPWNPTDTKTDIGYNDGAWVALAFPIIYFIGLILVTIGVKFGKTCSNIISTLNSSLSIATRGGDGSENEGQETFSQPSPSTPPSYFVAMAGKDSHV